MGEFGHFASRGDEFFLDSWGAGPFLLRVNGKEFLFEDSDRFGPLLVSKRDPSRILDGQPGSRSPFWEAHRIWVKQGRRLAADQKTCVFEVWEP